jgi:hypothetical protein
MVENTRVSSRIIAAPIMLNDKPRDNCSEDGLVGIRRESQ